MTKNWIQHALGKLNGYFDSQLNIFFQIVFTFYTLKPEIEVKNGKKIEKKIRQIAGVKL